jgi:hypothetical protein
VSEGLVLTVEAGVQTSALSFTGLGSAGLLLLASCDAPAWLSLYVSAEAAVGDAARLQSEDPAPDAGVVLDAVFTDQLTALRLPPGVSWANQDEPQNSVLHGRLRTDLPAPADVAVALTALRLSA